MTFLVFRREQRECDGCIKFVRLVNDLPCVPQRTEGMRILIGFECMTLRNSALPLLAQAPENKQHFSGLFERVLYDQ